MRPVLRILRLESHDPAHALPAYESAAAAGMDLRACLADDDRTIGLKVPSLARVLVPTGLAMAIPEGHEAQIRPRSGMALRHGITVLNSPGTIDADYRGEIKVLVVNLGPETVTLAHGERVAQLVIAPCVQVSPESVTVLDETARGAGGFGSTGVK